jgi:hypothetical protein
VFLDSRIGAYAAPGQPTAGAHDFDLRALVAHAPQKCVVGQRAPEVARDVDLAPIGLISSLADDILLPPANYWNSLAVEWSFLAPGVVSRVGFKIAL